MQNQQRNVYLSPHWKMDRSLVEGPDSAGSFTIPVTALRVIWGSDPRYWKWIELSGEETRSIGFQEAALLDQVNWIEVTGKLDVPTLWLANHKTYKIYYVVKFMADAFGWHSAPIKFMVKINTQEIKTIELKLEHYKEKPDEWHEIPGGKFKIVENETTFTSVGFGMFEVDTEWWKGGMVLAGVKIMPDAGHVIELN